MAELRRWLRVKLELVDSPGEDGFGQYNHRPVAEQTLILPVEGQIDQDVSISELGLALRNLFSQGERTQPRPLLMTSEDDTPRLNVDSATEEPPGLPF